MDSLATIAAYAGLLLQAIGLIRECSQSFAFEGFCVEEIFFLFLMRVNVAMR